MDYGLTIWNIYYFHFGATLPKGNQNREVPEFIEFELEFVINW